MSLITQCPACDTLFKVVPDQLRISDGWVRCGQCDEVFDANAHLQSTALAPVRAAAPAPESENLPVHRQDSVDATPDMGLPGTAESVPAPDVLQQEVPAEPASQAPLPAFKSDWTDDETPPPTEEEMHAWVLAAVAAEASDLKAQTSGLMDALPRYLEVQAPTPEPESQAEPLAVAFGDSTYPPQSDGASRLDEPHTGEPLLSFMQPAAAPSVWDRPSVRKALWIACVTLGCALVLQILVYQRDVLAAKAPATQPVLQALCGVVGCQVSPLREIESVVIDSSAFVKIRPDVYRVHFTLKNAAVYAVGTPSLELTLTNTRDQAIVRRVFSPPEFGVQQASMLPGEELNAVVSLGVQLADDAQRVSGYRLLVFYP